MFYVLKFTFHLRIIGANSWHNRECLEALRNSTMGHFRGILRKGLVQGHYKDSLLLDIVFRADHKT